MNILVNHIGYDPICSKKAIVQSDNRFEIESFQIVEGNQVVYSGKPGTTDMVNNWKGMYFSVLDFSDFDKPGKFKIKLPEQENMLSDCFTITENCIFNETITDVLEYFYNQRSSGVFDKKDHNIGFYGGNRLDTVDVHGGWFDASGDTSKYLSHLSYANFMNPQQSPLIVYSLLEASCNLEDKQLKQLAKEEAAFGADFLIRMFDPEGYFYMTVFDKWSKDPGQREICSYTTQKGHKFETWQAGFRQGGGVSIAALARACSLGLNGDYSQDQYLDIAKKGYEHLKENNIRYLDDNKENIIDDYCALLAAVELYNATFDEGYLEDADNRALSLVKRISEDTNYSGWLRADDNNRPFFHATEEGFPLVSLSRYIEIAGEEKKDVVIEAIRRLFKFQIKINKEVYNPFGYARQYVKSLNGKKSYISFFMPHENETGYWWQGENARICSLAFAFKRILPHLESDVCRKNALEFRMDQINWVLGLNPFDMCMLTGKGKNNPEYNETGAIGNLKGGLCNGITSGFKDELDICFAPEEANDSSHTWRWQEQWIPQAAWFLLALL